MDGSSAYLRAKDAVYKGSVSAPTLLNQPCKRFSAKDWKRVIDLLDAIANSTAAGGGITITKSQGNWIFEVKPVTNSASDFYKLEYDVTKNTSYVFGNIVRVSPSNPSAASDSNPTGTIPGVYICIGQPTNNTTQIPSHPLSDGGEDISIYWQWLSTWPSVEPVCVAGEPVDFATDSQKITYP